MKIRYVSLDRRQPPIDIRDLGLMLEIDLMLGRQREFDRRLQRALDNACRQGRMGTPEMPSTKTAQIRHLRGFSAKKSSATR